MGRIRIFKIKTIKGRYIMDKLLTLIKNNSKKITIVGILIIILVILIVLTIAIIKENENAEEIEAYEEKIIKLLAEILMEIQE